MTTRSTTILQLMTLLFVAMLTGMTQASAVEKKGDKGADPAQDLSGKSFSIILTNSATKETQKDRLVFTAKDVTCAALGGKLPYTAAKGDGKSKSVKVTATITDAKGGTVALSCTISGEKVTGTITNTPKDGAATVIAISSPGSDKPEAPKAPKGGGGGKKK